MKKNIIFMCLCVMFLISMAGANTVWNPAGNEIFPPDVGLWSDPNNWANGRPVGEGDGTEDNDPKAVFNLADPAECQVTDNLAICACLSMGDGGADSPHNAVLRLLPNTTLTITGIGHSWSAIGYSRKGNTVIVEEGALLDIDAHLYVGMNGTDSPQESEGRLIINGGTVLVADTFRYGREAGAEGYVDLNAGLFQARYLNATGPYGGLFDIKFGKYRLTGGEDSDRDRLQRDIDNGYVVGFGGAGTVNLAQEANGDWYVTAISPMNPTPAYDSTVPDGSVDLSWTNLDPNSPGDSVWVDVWFGTEPDKLSLAYSQVVTTEENWTTVNVSAPVIGTAPTTYYWQVDSYIYGDPDVVNYNDPNISVIEGDVFKFHVSDDFPPTVVIDTEDAITWVNEPVDLSATVTDLGSSPSPLHIEWTSSDAGAVFSPSNTVANPTVTVDNAAGAVTLTCTVWDDDNGVGEADSDTVIVTVYADACEAARVGAGLAAQYPLDAVADCVINLKDFAVMAAIWLEDYALAAPAPN